MNRHISGWSAHSFICMRPVASGVFGLAPWLPLSLHIFYSLKKHPPFPRHLFTGILLYWHPFRYIPLVFQHNSYIQFDVIVMTNQSINTYLFVAPPRHSNTYFPSYPFSSTHCTSFFHSLCSVPSRSVRSL
jgi:hypothetical protein